MGVALPRTRYLVKVKDGRIGKARQIKPFEIEVKSLPHDLDKIADELCRYISRYTKTKGTDVQIILPPRTTSLYAEVYSSHSQTAVGLVRIDQIEEDEDTNEQQQEGAVA